MPTALSTDLYELTMAAGHFGADTNRSATFELSVRGLPLGRGYLLAAGIEPALTYLEELRFTAPEIDYLRQIPQLRRVPSSFFDDYLPGFRFTGDVWGMAEGEPVFANEPLLRVTAPLVEAQVVETALLSTVLFQTSVASRASRMVRAAAGRPVFELGARRAHGAEGRRARGPRGVRGRLQRDVGPRSGAGVRRAAGRHDGAFLGDEPRFGDGVVRPLY